LIPKEIIDGGLALMKSAPAAYLTTIDEHGYPVTRAMLNLHNESQYPELQETLRSESNPFTVYFTTNMSSAKVAQLKACAKVSIYFCDPTRFHGLMLSADAELLTATDSKHRFWVDGWQRYYPRGKDDPDYAIIKAVPRSARGWYHTRTYEFSPTDRDRK
jgi:general stress protein 26